VGRLEARPEPSAGRSPDREQWLGLLAELFDAETTERLDGIGLPAGSRALELGAGTGSIAAWLGQRVGPEGRVVATDIDTRFMDWLDQPNVDVLQHDVLADDLPPDSFDLVHCRAVLVHVAEPERALERLVGWLRPGGLLLAEEPWTDVGLLAPDPVVARAARALTESAPRLDGAFARRLPQALRESGLEQVRAEGKFSFFAGGTQLASFFKHALAGASVPLVAAGELGRDEVAQMLARFDDPSFSDCGWPRIAAWGRKPG
jgi:SAM-dependent methyltransferase